jgi:hypothetical protein
MHSAVVPFRNTVIPKGINSLHLCNFCYKLGVWFITTLLCNNINRNDILGLLLGICYTVATLMCVLWKAMRATAIELWCLDGEHLYWSYYDGRAVAIAGSPITFLIITLML